MYQRIIKKQVSNIKNIVFEQFFSLVEDRHDIFVTGGAGVGKTIKIAKGLPKLNFEEEK